MIQNNAAPKISIIIPMYMCADYVDRLFHMVCGQSMSDIEIICVLDGPDEDIRRKVTEKAKSDDRIVCIEQEHGGAGTARNTGLDRARGEYLLFLDADDLFSQQMCEKMYAEAKRRDADTVMCSYTESNAWRKTRRKGQGFYHSKYPEGCVIDPSEVSCFLSSFIGAPWNKLFRHAMVKEHDLRFSETRIANDEFFVSAAMVSSHRIAVIHEDLLTVRRHDNVNSISSNRARYTQDCVSVMDEIYGWLISNRKWDHYRNGYCRKYMKALIYHAGYDHNEKFTDGTARALSVKEPWKSMSNTELVQFLHIDRYSLRAARGCLNILLLMADNSDNEGYKSLIRTGKNTLYNLEQIRFLMKDKYGRDPDEGVTIAGILTSALKQAGPEKHHR